MTRVQAAAPSRPSVDPRVRARSRADGWKRRFPLLPALVFAIVVTQLPFLLTIWFSLHSWNLLRGEEPRFVGLANFAQMWLDATFRGAALNTVLITASATLLSVTLGLLLALLVHRRFLGRGIVRTLLISPFLVMPAAAALLWKTSMLDPTFGIVNFLLSPFGLGRFDWLSQASIPSIVLILVWQW